MSVVFLGENEFGVGFHLFASQFLFSLSFFLCCEFDPILPHVVNFLMTLKQLMAYLSFLTAVSFVGYPKLRHFSASDPNLYFSNLIHDWGSIKAA